MSDNQIDVSKVIGQIEDELRDIKSAKEQIEAVIGSNEALVNSLNALLESASKMSSVTEDSAQKIIAEVSGKVEALSLQAADIDSQAKQGISILNEQAALAQSRFESELADFTQNMIKEVSTTTKQGLETVKTGLDEYPVLMDATTRKLTGSTTSFLAKQESQIAEIGNLVDSIQNRQKVITAKVKELQQLDIVSLLNEVREVRRIELENTSATKKWRIVELGAFVVCIVLGILIFVKLFTM